MFFHSIVGRLLKLFILLRWPSAWARGASPGLGLGPAKKDETCVLFFKLVFKPLTRVESDWRRLKPYFFKCLAPSGAKYCEKGRVSQKLARGDRQGKPILGLLTLGKKRLEALKTIFF